MRCFEFNKALKDIVDRKLDSRSCCQCSIRVVGALILTVLAMSQFHLDPAAIYVVAQFGYSLDCGNRSIWVGGTANKSKFGIPVPLMLFIFFNNRVNDRKIQKDSIGVFL